MQGTPAKLGFLVHLLLGVPRDEECSRLCVTPVCSVVKRPNKPSNSDDDAASTAAVAFTEDPLFARLVATDSEITTAKCWPEVDE